MEQQHKLDRIITRDQEQPPLTFGPKRIHYLYSVVLPQIHLTLVSVLQGIVFGVLLINIPLPPTSSWPAILYYLLDQYLYLPYGISSAVIIIIWIQFVEVTMFLFWPLSLVQAILVFLLTLCEIIAFRQIESLPIWLVGLGCIALVGGWITRRNLVLNTEEIYESMGGLQKSFSDFSESARKSSYFYFIIGSITLVLGLTFNSLNNIYGTRFAPITPYISWGIILLLSACVIRIVRMDLYYRKRWIEHAIENTDLRLTPQGVIMYIPKDEGGQNAKNDTSNGAFL